MENKIKTLHEATQCILSGLKSGDIYNGINVTEYIGSVQESAVISNPDTYMNFELWEKVRGHNILFITGLSGSGKSTLATELAKTNDAEVIRLDGFEHDFDSSNYKILDSFKAKHPEMLPHFENHWKDAISANLKYVIESLTLYMTYVIKTLYTHPNKLFIVEGVQLYFDDEIIDFIKGKPLIIKGTSALKSYSRQIKREMQYTESFGENLNVLYQYAVKDRLSGLKNSTKNDKFLTDFKNRILVLNNSSKLFHVSDTNLSGKTIMPSIPNNYMTEHGFENNTIARISFAPSIGQCLAGISDNLEGKILYVHEPSNYAELIITPNADIIKQSYVPDAPITGEVWSMKPTRLRCVSKIKILKAIRQPHTYMYGDNTASLYFWDYKVIE
jgi:uridine kinase